MSIGKIAFLWTKSPLIVNAPMGGIAQSQLAISVSRAGGLGLIGAVNDMEAAKSELRLIEEHFSAVNDVAFDFNSLPTIPVGIGFLLFVANLDSALDVLRSCKKPPAVVWLFASPEPEPIRTYATWTSAIHKEFRETKVWIQVGGGVGSVVETVRLARPDVIVVQGSDAGGHGSEVGASLFGILPESIDVLRSLKINIPVVASGGIVDARGAAAALMLGASAVVLGTRFLASNEVKLPHPEYQKRIISTSDGPKNTVRAKVFDELKGPNIWPSPYDGRALLSASYKDWKAGATPEEIVQRMKDASIGGEQSDMGFGIGSDRAAIWAGSGVGLVKTVMPASQIVVEVREGIEHVLESFKSRL